MDNKEFSTELAHSHVLRGNVTFDALRHIDIHLCISKCGWHGQTRLSMGGIVYKLDSVRGSILQIEPKRFSSGYKSYRRQIRLRRDLNQPELEKRTRKFAVSALLFLRLLGRNEQKEKTHNINFRHFRSL